MDRSSRVMSLDQIRPNPRNARTHSKKQIRKIEQSIRTFGFTNPLLIDEHGLLLAGHGRHAAAKLAGLKEVPVVQLSGLSEGKKRALLIADNKLAEDAGWDRERLAIELPELAEILVAEDLDISITGFDPPEIDQIATDFEERADPGDDIEASWTSGPAVSSAGDVWLLGGHRLMCGSACDAGHLSLLLGTDRVAMAFFGCSL